MTIVIPTLHVRPSPQAVPLAGGCLAASLSDDDRKGCRLIDLFPSMTEEEMLERILSLSPDIVAFPLYAWNRTAILSLSRRIRETNPRIKLVAGGPEAAADARSVLGEGKLDVVVRGEGEAIFPTLVEVLRVASDLSKIPGISFFGEGNIIETPDLQPTESLQNYRSPWLSGTLSPKSNTGILWETARGCPFSCDFCFDTKGQKGVVPIPFERLETELDLFVKAGVSQVWVLDSTFNFPPQRGKKLLRLIAKKAPSIHFHLEAKAEFLDEEITDILSRIPCSVQIGLQSVREEVLRNLHRSCDLKTVEKNLHLLSTEGVTFGVDLIYGLPGDTHPGFCESLGKALSFLPNQVDIFPLAVLPGTPLHKDSQRYGLKALKHPPYTVIESDSYSAGDMAASRLLAAATDIFYNIGRAVGFFPSLTRGVKLKAVPFLKGFAKWALETALIPEERFLDPSNWTVTEILDLQKGYISHLFKKSGKEKLLPSALDLVNYHYHYAETLLGGETLPSTVHPDFGRCWRVPLRLGPNLRLVPFSYEILDLLEMGEVDLEAFTEIFRPVGSVGLFFRRGNDVFCESLEEDFLTLLQGSDGTKTPEEIFSGCIDEREGREIVEFALAEGFLTF